jgi:ribosomal protein L37E
MENDKLKDEGAKDNIVKPHVNGSADLEDEFYDEDYYEGQPHENCEKCGRDYDDIDFDYQSCSKCGWDTDKQKWGEKREPTDEDYMNGDADILTGRWH